MIPFVAAANIAEEARTPNRNESADMADENSLERRHRVAATTAMVSDIGSGFTHTFPPRSLTILRLKTR